MRTEVVQPQRTVLLNFQPINPNYIHTAKNEDELNLEQYFPQPNRLGNGNTNLNQDPEERQLHVIDIPVEFPLIPNSMDGERTRKYKIKLHLELKTHGYVLDGSDIKYCCPLGSQARGHSKMSIVVTYRDSDTTQNVTQVAKKAGLWNQRKSKEDDKIMDRKGYFKVSFPRRDTNTKRSRKPHTELCGGDRPKKKTNTKRSQSSDRKLSKVGENSIKNWLEEQDNPRFKPTLNLRKVDCNFPNLGNQLEKLKADREERERKTNKSAASSVEFLDEVIHITGQPVSQEPGTKENDRSDSPLTPLARGWVPPYTGTETPQASGEEPTFDEESPKDGELPPSDNSSPRQQTVTLESGECTPSSDDPQSNQSYVIEFPSNHEGRDRVQHLPGQQTAAMRKEIPSYWPRNPYDYRLDQTPMPTRPGGAPTTPLSPLNQTPETIWDIQQAAQIVEGLKQLRKAAVPNPELSPMGHENANEDPQADDHTKVVQEMIDPTPIPENKPRRKKITKIVYDRSPMKTPNRVWSPWIQGLEARNIKDRLGQCHTKTKHEKIGAWSPWIQGREPKNNEQWNNVGFLGHPN